MGKSDPYLKHIYGTMFPNSGEIALLGFTNNDWSYGDLYDLRLGNWDINSDWSLPKKYDAIVSTRCPYFAQDPEDFIRRCHENLKEGGQIFIDWGLGDHWRFEKFKVGWVKDNEHEYAYDKNNYLWSTLWDDRFLDNDQVKLFEQRIKKFGYTDLKQAIYDEVPKVLNLSYVEKYFGTGYQLFTLWEEMPQLYIFLKGIKR
jgi:SAM-dependent methyltransferase|tara:strand:- start:16496 stop:17098 length:603 start_codon:yes stop_codon:yes gene_type:complete